jgi:hypothetical protein
LAFVERLALAIALQLPPLEIGDHVMLQNQLGNKPKRWDKRGVVVQADPKTRQYKVMALAPGG